MAHPNARNRNGVHSACSSVEVDFRLSEDGWQCPPAKVDQRSQHKLASHKEVAHWCRVQQQQQHQ
jgi:hypothetical protein